MKKYIGMFLALMLVCSSSAFAGGSTAPKDPCEVKYGNPWVPNLQYEPVDGVFWTGLANLEVDYKLDEDGNKIPRVLCSTFDANAPVGSPESAFISVAGGRFIAKKPCFDDTKAAYDGAEYAKCKGYV